MSTYTEFQVGAHNEGLIVERGTGPRTAEICEYAYVRRIPVEIAVYMLADIGLAQEREREAPRISGE